MVHLQLVKISLKVGLVTSGITLVYLVCNQFLIYHYFKYEYFVAAAVIIALATGILLTNGYYRQQVFNEIKSNPLETLTAKELQILSLINAGKSNKEIAAINYIELSTVKTHINNIFFKLGVKNRMAAARIYQKSTFSPPVQI